MGVMGKQSSQVWLVAGVALLLGAIPVLIVLPTGKGKPARALMQLDAWSVPQFVEYLEGRLPGLRAVPTNEQQSSCRNSYLTRTDWGWDRLNQLPWDRRRIDRWRGTAYCERISDPEERNIVAGMWGDCGMAAGPFVLFGDSELLAEIRKALTSD
jgi:hypothetical protein